MYLPGFFIDYDCETSCQFLIYKKQKSASAHPQNLVQPVLIPLTNRQPRRRDGYLIASYFFYLVPATPHETPKQDVPKTSVFLPSGYCRYPYRCNNGASQNGGGSDRRNVVMDDTDLLSNL